MASINAILVRLGIYPSPINYCPTMFWIDCTPSYMNGEGERDNPHGFYANAHPAGTIDFYKMLATWRSHQDLKGL